MDYATGAKGGDICEIFVHSARTNLARLNVPEPGQALLVELRDSNGNAVAKTEAGRGQGRPLDKRVTYRPHSYKMVSPGLNELVYSFGTHEFFHVTRPGEYEFSVQLQLYEDNRRTSQKRYFDRLVFPVVKAKVNLPPSKAARQH